MAMEGRGELIMSNALKLTIWGSPIPQGRPRFARIGKFVKTYDPKESRSWKDTVRAQTIDTIEKEHRGYQIFNGPLSMSIHFFFLRPKGHYGSGRNAQAVKRSAPSHHTSKPDIDNLGKAIKDALKGLCYKDDSQIFRCLSEKTYDDRPRVEVVIEEEDNKYGV